jgi:hypothetical protein
MAIGPMGDGAAEWEEVFGIIPRDELNELMPIPKKQKQEFLEEVDLVVENFFEESIENILEEDFIF